MDQSAARNTSHWESAFHDMVRRLSSDMRYRDNPSIMAACATAEALPDVTNRVEPFLCVSM